MRTALILLFSCLCISAFAQEPYVAIFINVGNPQTAQDSFTVFICKQSEYDRKVWDRPEPTKVGYDVYRHQFHHSEYGPYCREIYELTIVRGQDTMRIRFRQDSLGPGIYRDCATVLEFRLNIPFQKGYYELSDFVRINGDFAINPSYHWKNIPLEERRLVLKSEK